MIMSKKLTVERLREIAQSPIVYDEDSPELTSEQLARLCPKHPENRKHAEIETIPAGNDALFTWVNAGG
jgi:hypothetical protein